MLPAPLASWDSEQLADWLELKAIASTDGNSSITDLVREFQRNGTTEEVLEVSGGDDFADVDDEREEPDVDARSMSIAENAFAAIEERTLACDGAYPFSIDTDSIKLNEKGIESAYAFMLLLGEYGQKSGFKKAAKIFEYMCAWAARSYFGPQAFTRVFGFPRETGVADALPKGFASAVDDLCKALSEGIKCKRTPKAAHEKDAGLDVIVWRNFPDRRAGKLIAFGQCATGDDWTSKTTELLPEAWCHTWLEQQPFATPLSRLFFLPYTIKEIDWELVSRRAGIVFDRCRLAYCIQHSGNDAEVRKKWVEWAATVYAKIRAGTAHTLHAKEAS